MQQPQQDQYSYSSQPHAAPVKGGKKTKYREEDELNISGPGNLMNDPRVIRGNTYAANIPPEGPKQKGAASSSSRREPGGRKKFVGKRVSSPPPVDGRIHMDMQTDNFLEELTDRPIECEAETQTQAFSDRPASPLFIRAKTGNDMETQILSGDLFDFDLEVEPLLEVLVGKTIHVAMLELMQEEELEAIRYQQEQFESIRNVELSEVQRLEAEARRRAQEKERRVAQEKKRVAEKRDLEEKIAARSFTKQYLGNLHTGVFDMLEEEGHFYDPVQKEVEEIFMVNLLGEIRRRSDCYDAATQMANELIESAKTMSKDFENKAIELRKILADRLEAERKEQEERLAAQKKAEAELAAAALAVEGAEE